MKHLVTQALARLAATAGHEDVIRQFFRAHPNPDDAQVHEFARSLGMTPEDLEAEIYRLFTECNDQAMGDWCTARGCVADTTMVRQEMPSIPQSMSVGAIPQQMLLDAADRLKQTGALLFLGAATDDPKAEADRFAAGLKALGAAVGIKPDGDGAGFVVVAYFKTAPPFPMYEPHFLSVVKISSGLHKSFLKAGYKERIVPRGPSRGLPRVTYFVKSAVHATCTAYPTKPKYGVAGVRAAFYTAPKYI